MKTNAGFNVVKSNNETKYKIGKNTAKKTQSF